MNRDRAAKPLAAVLAAAGVLASCALVWYIGPLIALGEWRPFESTAARWAAIAALVFAAAGYVGWRVWLGSRNDRELIAGLTAGAHAEPGAADAAAISQRFNDALATLARRDGGKQLYRRPWYLIIGAPGAGKTTALMNAGLGFDKNAGAVRGVGGTRHCDWWFAPAAVLIDTAGRFTTQDSDRAADSAAWAGFLRLLAKHRPQRPINGVIVAVSASELLLADTAAREEHARTLRARLDELRAELRIRFPIYVLVTKTDLVAGFDELFADYDQPRRDQVWGATLPYGSTAPAPGAPALAAIGSELTTLERRLNDIVLERLRPELDRTRRAAIYQFPQQWRIMKDALAEVLERAFAPELGVEPLLLRGVYFSSGTQEGTPIDRAIGATSRALGLAPRTLQGRGTGKSFFLARLMREVIFAEAGLAGTNLGWERRRAALQWSALAATIAIVASGFALWWQEYRSNAQHIGEIASKLGMIEQEVERVRGGANATEPSALAPILQSMHAIATAESAAEHGRFGLDHSLQLAAGARDAYQRLLKEGLLPRIAMRLEQRLREFHAARNGATPPELAYEALKAYLMLFGGRNFDRAALRSYLQADWNSSPLAEPDRERLRFHLDQLLAGGEVGAPTQANAAVIAQARELVSRVPLRERAFHRVTRLEGADEPPAFTLKTAAGEAAESLFGRGDSKAAANVPGMFTHAGYHRGFRERARVAVRTLAREESWVMDGKPIDMPIDSPLAERLLAEVEERYLAEYATRWERFIAGITLARPESLTATAELARMLARPDSPLVGLLNAIGKEISLGTPEASRVDERFRELRALVSGTPAPLQDVLAVLDKLGLHLAAVDDAGKRRVGVPASPVLGEVAALGARSPEPVRGMLQELAAVSAAQLAGARRVALVQSLNEELLPACARTLAGRYPFAKRGAEEVSRADFVRAFAAGGLFDGFSQRHLADAESLISLAPFQRARQIRESLFRDGGKQLGSALEFRLMTMDATLAGLTLEIDGQIVALTSTARGPFRVQWPGPGNGEVKLVVAPHGADSTSFTFGGPWGLYRLLDRVRIEPGGAPNAHQLTFDIEGRRARVLVQSSGPSPLRLPALEQFECPQKS